MADIYKSKFTGQEIDDILTNASNVTNIEANPSGEATEELTKLKIGDTIYSIPEQSGGGDTPTIDMSNVRGFLAANADGGIEVTDLRFYLYNNGMTWSDFINSAFNIDGGHIDGSTVYLTENGILSGVTPTSTITNKTYTYGHGGGSN